jgi:hypothetical protein
MCEVMCSVIMFVTDFYVQQYLLASEGGGGVVDLMEGMWCIKSCRDLQVELANTYADRGLTAGSSRPVAVSTKQIPVSADKPSTFRMPCLRFFLDFPQL